MSDTTSAPPTTPFTPPARPQRMMGWLRPDRPLQCPKGHRMRWDTELTEEGFPRCKERVAPGAECGARMLVIVHLKRGQRMRDLLAGASGGDRWKALRAYVIEVDRREIEYMAQRHMDLDEMLEFLGASWNPGCE